MASVVCNPTRGWMAGGVCSRRGDYKVNCPVGAREGGLRRRAAPSPLGGHQSPIRRRRISNRYLARRANCPLSQKHLFFSAFVIE